MSTLYDKALTLMMAAAYFMLGASALLGTVALVFRWGTKDVADVAFMAMVWWVFLTSAKMADDK
jgi:hypothetical protein